MYDKDGSGTIEMGEMIEVLETVYVMEGVMSTDNTAMAKNRAKQIFGELDADGNGSLTCDEFIEGIYFKKRNRVNIFIIRKLKNLKIGNFISNFTYYRMHER